MQWLELLDADHWRVKLAVGAGTYIDGVLHVADTDVVE